MPNLSSVEVNGKLFQKLYNADGSYTAGGQQFKADGTPIGAPPPTDAQKAAAVTAGIADGSQLPGAYQNNSDLQVQSQLMPNLSDAQVIAQQRGDFGLGTDNNAPTAAAIDAANATAGKYSAAFGGQAATANAQSAADASRGTGMYQGNTGAYTAAVGNAQQDRSMQTGAYGQLMNFAAQGPGPSAAQAQLQQATNANQATALAMARSGRGMGGSAAGMRQAIAQNAVTQQNANAQGAELMANENTAYQGQRLSALGQAGSVAGQTVGADQGTAASGLAGAQYQTNTTMQGTQLNDASAQAWANQQLNATQQGLGAESYGQTQGLNIDASALAGRESQWASLNQNHATDAGVSTQAGIADANRQQAYIGAGLAAAGTVIGAVAGGPAGAVAGGAGGAAVGTAVSDVRAKTNIVPLSELASKALGGAGSSLLGRPQNYAYRQTPHGQTDPSLPLDAAYAPPSSGPAMVRNPNNPSQLISAYAPISAASRGAHGSSAAPASQWATEVGKPEDPWAALQRLSPGTPVATSATGVDKYASEAAPKADKVTQRFARDDSHPILSAGDSLLADTARRIPGSVYQYIDPADGAGTYVGPMAQDLAANPVTSSTVVQQPSGKLGVDTGRLSTVNTATNHAQQNQLDALDARIQSLTDLLHGSSAYPDTQQPDASVTSDERYKTGIVRLSQTPRGAPYPGDAPQRAPQSPYQPIEDASRYAGRVTFRPTGGAPYPGDR